MTEIRHNLLTSVTLPSGKKGTLSISQKGVKFSYKNKKLHKTVAITFGTWESIDKDISEWEDKQNATTNS